MQSERQTLEDVFRLVMEASGKLWDAVAAIRSHETTLSAPFTQPLMEMRGDMHVKFLRPIYKKYPELATKFGLDDEPDDRS